MDNDERLEDVGFTVMFADGRVHFMVSEVIERDGARLSTRSDELVAVLGAPDRRDDATMSWQRADMRLRIDTEGDPRNRGSDINAYTIEHPK